MLHQIVFVLVRPDKRAIKTEEMAVVGHAVVIDEENVPLMLGEMRAAGRLSRFKGRQAAGKQRGSKQKRGSAAASSCLHTDKAMPLFFAAVRGYDKAV